MSEYWLISAPGDKTCQQTFDTMNNLTSNQNNLCNNYKFHIPDLKVGTLDQLVGLSDDLGKLDTYVEQITRKVAAYLGEVLEDQRDKLHENLLANNSPGPHDESTKFGSGMSSNLSNKSNHRKKSTTNLTACYSGSSISNSGTDESYRKLDLLSPLCNCADCTTVADICGRNSTATLVTNTWYSNIACSLSVTNTATYAISVNTPSTTNNSYWLTSTPTDVHRLIEVTRSSDHNQINNNICSINDNKLEFSNSDLLGTHPTNHSNASEMNGQLQTSNNTSYVNDALDWRFNKHTRNSRRSRSSPMSNCCGGISQGRSSPDTDPNEIPMFPLSPADLSIYITRFQWDMAKYPIKQSLRNIADIISKQIGQIDADLKTKSNAYNNLKGSLQNLEKKQTGSLLTRNLAELVKKEHFILDSEYLTTLLVIVPKMIANDWVANYEKITDMIVPRSSTMITQDHDFCLFNVTLFKKVVEEFKLHAREKKFIVRDFVYNEEELAAGKNEITKLITDKKKQFGPLVRWLKVNFSEAFCALVHVKALRVFVESVLRYGLPVNFQAIIIEPSKKSVKRLRECLNQLYGHLDGASAAGQAGGVDNVDIPGLGFGQSEYYPYVFYKVNIDMVETAKI